MPEPNATPPVRSCRIDFLRAQWAAPIQTQLAKEHYIVKSPADAFAWLSNFDFTIAKPDKPGRYLDWLCRQFCQGGIKPEDVYKIRDDLEFFDALKTRQKLPPDMRDINRLTAATLKTFLTNFYATTTAASQRDLNRAERVAIDSETTYLYDGQEGKILIPHTLATARFWGRNTRWCTAAKKDSDNEFDEYNKKGPLLIFILPDGKKFQSHKTSVIRDAEDEEIKIAPITALKTLLNAGSTFLPPDFLARHAQYETVDEPIEELTTEDQKILESFPADEKIDAYNLLTHNFSLCDIDEVRRSRALCLLAIRERFAGFKDVPADLIDYKFYQDAIDINGSLLHYIPTELVTRELCLAAVCNDGLSLESVPAKLYDTTLIQHAVEQNGAALKYVLVKEMNYDLCLSAVLQNGLALKHVPKQYRDDAMYLAAVQQDAFALRYIPQENLNQAICTAAIQKDGASICYFTNKFINHKLCLMAVQSNPAALQSVPSKYKDISMKRITLQGDGRILFDPEVFKESAMARLDFQRIALLSILEMDHMQRKDDDGDKIDVRDYLHLFPGLRQHPEVYRDPAQAIACLDQALAARKPSVSTAPLIPA